MVRCVWTTGRWAYEGLHYYSELPTAVIVPQDSVIIIPSPSKLPRWQMKLPGLFQTGLPQAWPADAPWTVTAPTSSAPAQRASASIRTSISNVWSHRAVRNPPLARGIQTASLLRGCPAEAQVSTGQRAPESRNFLCQSLRNPQDGTAAESLKLAGVSGSVRCKSTSCG